MSAEEIKAEIVRLEKRLVELRNSLPYAEQRDELRREGLREDWDPQFMVPFHLALTAYREEGEEKATHAKTEDVLNSLQNSYQVTRRVAIEMVKRAISAGTVNEVSEGVLTA